jgi:hypothetical protein
MPLLKSKLTKMSSYINFVLLLLACSRPLRFRQASQFYKEIRLVDAYQNCKRAALVQLVAIDAKDPLCNSLSEISTYFCRRTIETDIPSLSLLVLEYINGKHDRVQTPDSEGLQGTHFTPSMHKQSTQCVPCPFHRCIRTH